MRDHPVSVVGSWLAAALTGLAASSANAASFNCQRAALPAEKAICGDANLSSLDERTAGMYFLPTPVRERPQPSRRPQLNQWITRPSVYSRSPLCVTIRGGVVD
jgi:uncharacterized protein